ncbi:hypothetical protein SEUBUCD646_0E01760 [Saccharomyces eubayanus]|uniref:Myb-like domain-containing protein n=1 Tax=Saccharomyces eubayanus TaxID=1080349 RepID=A0ABN8VU11_SACEU|nr:hypothetical protein SEUBUCD650_0E01800 [Saccharomyces eubayanus]CAI1985124.1 hypothetical protein SEUBUCD646_0E01760 [Saccharomyces eubayanus]
MMSVSTRLNPASIHLSTMSPHPQLHSLSRQPHASKSSDEAQESSPSLPPSKNSSKNPSSWDPQDDLLLRHLKEVKKMGWKDISQYFPNRTPNACQFRWRRLKSGNLKSNKTALIDINTYSGPVKITNTDSVPDEETAIEAPASASATPSIPIPSRKASLPSFSASMSFAHSPSNMTPPAIVPNAPSSIPFVPPQLPVAHLHHHPHHHLHHHPNHKALKPRSNSHSFTSSLNQDPVVRLNDEEKYGFIPKVCVRSRRSSFAYPQQAAITTTPSSPNSSHVLNSSLLGSKSRKDSFANWSRRSSFNISSNNTSRRSSIVLAPNSVSNVFNANTNNSSSSSNTNSRRESIIKKEFQQRLNHLNTSGASTPSNGAIFPASYTFMDLPRLSSVSSSSTTLPKFKRGSLSGHSTNPSKSSWSRDEDILLVENKKRNLSMMELSILLPQRTEVEIQWRLGVLSNDAEELSPVHSPQRTLAKKIRPRMFQTASTTDNNKENDNVRDDDEDDVDPLHRSKGSAHKTAFSSSSSNLSSKDVSPDPIFSPDPADDSSNASDSGSRFTITSETSFSNTTDRATSSKHPHDITLLDNFPSEAITPRPKPSSTTTSITTETTCNMMNHSSSTTTTTNNSPLPSINTIFKDML